MSPGAIFLSRRLDILFRIVSWGIVCCRITMVGFIKKILCVPFRHPQPPCPTPKGAIIVLAYQSGIFVYTFRHFKTDILSRRSS